MSEKIIEFIIKAVSIGIAGFIVGMVIQSIRRKNNDNNTNN